MKIVIFSFIISLSFLKSVSSLPLQADTFRWDRVTYVNLSVGEKFTFHDKEIELLSVRKHLNRIRVGEDTSWVKVSYRSPALYVGNLRLFVADNKAVRQISPNPEIHGLLKKDVLLAVSKASEPIIDRWKYAFPISFTDGYIWRNDEDSHFFSLTGAAEPKPATYRQFPGIAFDIKGARASQQHAIVAVESGRVVWVEDKASGTNLPTAAICIESGSSPGIYYIYRNLYNKYLYVNKNQRVERGDALGYVWGDGSSETLHLNVIRSDSVPTLARADENAVNFFPQLMEIYYGAQPLAVQNFSKGQIHFGRPSTQNGNAKNVSAFEEYQGMGWKFDGWNVAEKVEWVSTRMAGNARLPQVLFEGQRAHCTNPVGWYDFEINVKTGIYRIRALVGDCLKPSWQKMEYEGVAAGTYKLGPGEFTWTPEKIVRVRDGKLTIRIYLSEDKTQMAGISEIVFQQAD